MLYTLKLLLLIQSFLQQILFDFIDSSHKFAIETSHFRNLITVPDADLAIGHMVGNVPREVLFQYNLHPRSGKPQMKQSKAL